MPVIFDKAAEGVKNTGIITHYIAYPHFMESL